MYNFGQVILLKAAAHVAVYWTLKKINTIQCTLALLTTQFKQIKEVMLIVLVYSYPATILGKQYATGGGGQEPHNATG